MLFCSFFCMLYLDDVIFCLIFFQENVLIVGKKIFKEKVEEREKVVKLKFNLEFFVEKFLIVKKIFKFVIKLKLVGFKLVNTFGKNKISKVLKVIFVSTKKVKIFKGIFVLKKVIEIISILINVIISAKLKSIIFVYKFIFMVQKKKKILLEFFNFLRDQSMEVLIEDSEEEEILFKISLRFVRFLKTLIMIVFIKKKRVMFVKENNVIFVGRFQKKRKSVI